MTVTCTGIQSSDSQDVVCSNVLSQDSDRINHGLAVP